MGDEGNRLFTDPREQKKTCERSVGGGTKGCRTERIFYPGTGGPRNS